MGKKQLWIALGLVLFGAVMLVWPQGEDAEKRYFRNEGFVFGTTYSIQYEAQEDLSVQIKGALDAVDTSLSMFNEQSVLSRINRNEAVETTGDFEKVYLVAREVSEVSGGALDITIAPLVNLWGFGLKHREHVTSAMVDSLLPLVNYQGITLDNHHISKTNPAITLDCGAVAKGYGCDKVVEVLRANGVENLLVEIGGEVVAIGKNSKGQPWTIGITKPTDDPAGEQRDLQDIVQTEYICMATSGNYRNFYYDGSERRSHTIDPRTGYPVTHNLLAATVVAESCARADALATACMVLGADEAVKMIDHLDDAACYLIVSGQDGFEVLHSAKWTLVEKN